jgi:hypothetical protein
MSRRTRAPNPRPPPRTDHKNIAYSIGGQTVRLVDGLAEVPAAPGSAAKVVTRYFGNEVRGDLNADGREDVSFLLTQETGGSGTFFYAVAAARLSRSGPRRIDRGYCLGDRIAPQHDGASTRRHHRGQATPTAPRTKVSPTPPSVAKTILAEAQSDDDAVGEVVQNFEGEATPRIHEARSENVEWVRAC